MCQKMTKPSFQFSSLGDPGSFLNTWAKKNSDTWNIQKNDAHQDGVDF